ncbi:MAG TPA: o-succinylbenzoate synthase [Actinomycetota bacterium]|nr:o-succinylbenzoate synthase [Actinomycetota bacterium]
MTAAGEAQAGLSVHAIELREVALPLVRPFRTSFGEERDKRAILVRVLTDQTEGWGECVASTEPRYSEEWLEGAWAVLHRHVCPALLRSPPINRPEDVGAALGWVRGHRMAKAALEAAVLDAWLRTRGERLADFLGAVRDRVPCGVSVGIAPSIDALLEEVRGYLARGYRRVKLKIEPGWDAPVIRQVRAALPDTPLSVDANAAYSLSDLPVFEALDELDLVMIEQPLHHEDLVHHAKLQARLRTPICLDESIRSAADAATAIDLGACRVINIKPARVGGILEGKRVHDVATERGVPVWIGGMLETGIGRAPNIALAALEGVTMPGDTSASERYFKQDLTEPFVVDAEGTMAVPKGPGIGVEPLPERVDACTVRMETITVQN